MKIYCLMLGFCVMLFAGCGGGEERPYTDHSRDAEAMAIRIKDMVRDAVNVARGSDEPDDIMYSVAMSLEDLHRQPTGAHLSIYQQLNELALAIAAECEAADGRPPNLNERLDELAALAEQLPGERSEAQPAPQPD